MAGEVKLVNICPVFISDNVARTAGYYAEVLGFKFAHHLDKADKFATIYRDSVEIVIVQKRKGAIQSNTDSYGNGFDAYINTDTLIGVDLMFAEYSAKNVEIVKKPGMTDYGSYEFVFKDIDGRNIGIGLISEKKTYFADSNL